MSIHYKGFTIIEIMLFLAISSALTIAVMIGMGANISSQRYKDAVATLQSDVQQQFEDAVSVANFRSTSTPSDCDDSPRGASNCVVLGRFMTIGGGSAGGAIEQYSVYGREPNTTGDMGEYELIQSYNPAVLEDTVNESQMEWQTGIMKPGGDELSLGVLVIRSPRSGSVYTFTREGRAHTELATMITQPATERRIMCVSPSGWLVRDRMAVVIANHASTANAVEVLTNQMLAGEGTEC